MQHFIINRKVDTTGISGTGLVAWGHTNEDGTATVHWLGEWPSTTVHERGLEAVEHVHGHPGTDIVLCPPATSGVPVVPLGYGLAVWVPKSGPYGEDAWIYTGGDPAPTWNAAYEPLLSEGDHIFALEIDGQQAPMRDVTTTWATMVAHVARATGAWVTRCIAETGGDPAAVKVSLGDEAQPVESTAAGSSGSGLGGVGAQPQSG